MICHFAMFLLGSGTKNDIWEGLKCMNVFTKTLSVSTQVNTYLWMCSRRCLLSADIPWKDLSQTSQRLWYNPERQLRYDHKLNISWTSFWHRWSCLFTKHIKQLITTGGQLLCLSPLAKLRLDTFWTVCNYQAYCFVWIFTMDCRFRKQWQTTDHINYQEQSTQAMDDCNVL